MADEKSVAEQLLDVVRPVFRPGTVVQGAEVAGGCVISAAWRLGANRMDNWSREIRLLIPPEVMERYGKLNEKGKVKASANLVSYVRLKIGSFNPEHDRPRFMLPPVDEWRLAFDDIFPKK